MEIQHDYVVYVVFWLLRITRLSSKRNNVEWRVDDQSMIDKEEDFSWCDRDEAIIV